MTLVSIRPGVTFNNEPAASFKRVEKQAGRQIDVNRSTVPYDEQDKLYKEWQAGLHPEIPVVLDPDVSIHVYREWDSKSAHAVDSDDSQKLAKIFEDNGWVIVNKKELWHREYQKNKDKHYNDDLKEADWINMTKEELQELLREANDLVQIHYSSTYQNGVWLARPGYWRPLSAEEHAQMSNHGLLHAVKTIVPVNDRDFDVLKAIYTNT